MSGLGAPALTPTPTPDLARSTRLPRTSVPSVDEGVDVRARHDQQIEGLAGGDALLGVERAGEGGLDGMAGGLLELRHQFAIGLLGGLASTER